MRNVIILLAIPFFCPASPGETRRETTINLEGLAIAYSVEALAVKTPVIDGVLDSTEHILSELVKRGAIPQGEASKKVPYVLSRYRILVSKEAVCVLDLNTKDPATGMPLAIYIRLNSPALIKPQGEH